MYKIENRHWHQEVDDHEGEVEQESHEFGDTGINEVAVCMETQPSNTTVKLKTSKPGRMTAGLKTSSQSELKRRWETRWR